MSLSDATNLYHLLSSAGPGGVAVLAVVLIMVVVGSIRGWWHSGPAVRAMDAMWQARFKERDEQWKERFDDMKAVSESWRTLALSTGRTMGDAVQVAQAAIKAGPTP